MLSSLKSKAYDIVLNGYELGGGSIRIHRMDIQQKIFSLLGIDAESQRSEASASCWTPCSIGACRTAAWRLGLDRVVMILRNTTNIRDVIAFPKTQSGADLMCGAPSQIEDRQLKEANIKALSPRHRNHERFMISSDERLAK